MNHHFPKIKKPTLLKIFAPLLLLILLTTSCGTSRSTPSANDIPQTPHQKIIAFGTKYLRKPYRLGAKGPNAFDCSGFTAFVYRQFGYRLNSSSYGQSLQFPPINNRKELQVADLVFFEGRARNGAVGHVGIVTEVRPNGHFRFIHASTTRGVIISSSEEPYYKVRYLRGGRVVSNETYIAHHPKTATKAKPKTADKTTTAASTSDTARRRLPPRRGDVYIAMPDSSGTPQWAQRAMAQELAAATLKDAHPSPPASPRKNIPPQNEELMVKLACIAMLEPEPITVPEPETC